MQHAVLDEVITLNKAAMHGALDALEKRSAGRSGSPVISSTAPGR